MIDLIDGILNSRHNIRGIIKKDKWYMDVDIEMFISILCDLGIDKNSSIGEKLKNESMDNINEVYKQYCAHQDVYLKEQLEF